MSLSDERRVLLGNEQLEPPVPEAQALPYLVGPDTPICQDESQHHVRHHQLTTGVLAFLMDLRQQDHRLIETPELDIQYQVGETPKFARGPMPLHCPWAPLMVCSSPPPGGPGPLAGVRRLIRVPPVSTSL